MYEKYSGLPDTRKTTSSSSSRPASRPASKGGQSEYWLAALFTACGLFNLVYLVHVLRQLIKLRRTAGAR